MINILGISCFYHDSAAALVQDGEIISAAQEERFTRKKHDSSFPHKSINYCLEEAFIEANELNAIVFYDNPIVSFDRLIKSMIHSQNSTNKIWHKSIPRFLNSKFQIDNYIKDQLKVEVPILVTRHHLSHAASAFYPSPFEEAAILTIDGVGEWATTSICHGTNQDIKTIKEIKFPHSLGLLYSAFTYYCGFKVNSGEYKLMGLAPYGEPNYVDIIKRNLIHINNDGSYRLNMDYFQYIDSEYMINDKFNKLFNGLPRKSETKIGKKETDLAASIQKVTEEVVIGLAIHARDLTGSENICMAGGVALNCVANGILDRKKIYKKIWVQPAAGDAGGALGSALACSYMHFNVKRKILKDQDSQKGSYLGPCYSSNEIKVALDQNEAVYDFFNNENKFYKTISAYLADGKVVGYMSGRMEFGPRALGSRSILGDPRRKDTQEIMNLKIKYRESFRPFAPSILEDKAKEWFDLNNNSPYMLLVAPVKDKHLKKKAALNNDDNLLKIVKQIRSSIPAVTHVDYSARVQTVAKNQNPDYYRLISEFEKLTGYPLLVNTSFNVRGEPIVCSPDDAYRCFMRTEMDILVIGRFVLLKQNQTQSKIDDSWKEEYELD